MSDTIFAELWNNWMFRLSLSSNELFHSNFLQLILTDPAAPDTDGHGGPSTWQRIRDLARWAGIDAAWMDACQAQYGDCPVALYREWKQLDLAVVAKDRKNREVVLFAVELKVKSYPTLAQLHDYLKKMEAHNAKTGGLQPRLILLSLAGAPDGAEDLKGLGLGVMDFGQLAAGIAALPPAGSGLASASAEYVRLCKLLHQLGLQWKAVLTPQLALTEVIEPDQPYRRFHPIWSKLCAATLCELVARAMKDFPVGGDLALETVPGFSNGTWSADFLWRTRQPACIKRRGRPKALVAKVGVQVEGRTIRFMLNAEHVRSRSGDPRAVVEAALLAAAGRDGLFARPHALHAGALSRTAHAFWDRRPGFVHGDTGLPVGSAKGADGYRLTGYTINAGFGHADYRLQLDPQASVGLRLARHAVQPGDQIVAGVGRVEADIQPRLGL